MLTGVCWPLFTIVVEFGIKTQNKNIYLSVFDKIATLLMTTGCSLINGSKANEGRAATSLSNICVRFYMFGIARYPMQFSSS